MLYVRYLLAHTWPAVPKISKVYVSYARAFQEVRIVVPNGVLVVEDDDALAEGEASHGSSLRR